MVTVLYFAACRERAGLDEEALPLDGQSVRAALDALVARHPRLGEIRAHLRVAVNQAFVGDDDVVPNGAELALIPPVAGGAAPLARVLDAPLVVDDVVARVSHAGAGAVVVMIGTVRDVNEGEGVRGLRYEAYRPMAEKVMRDIVERETASVDGARGAVDHRVGALDVGDLAVVVAVSAPHRGDAFRACQAIIDALKKDAPIWKHETRASGQVWVGLGP